MERHEAAIPRTFAQYLRSMGPGIVIALTWLGAGDLVDSAVSGGNYGYALMWALALALFVRFVFVSIIAKYQLCNQHGESVLAGLRGIHPAVPIVVGVLALVFGHGYGSFSVKGAGEATAGLLGLDADLLWDVTASGKCIGPTYRNRWWENGLMACLFMLACWGGWEALNAVGRAVIGTPG